MSKPDFDRRNFLRASGIAGVGLLALGAAECGKKDVDFYVATVVGTLEELKPLIPAQATLLTRGISIAKSFNDAYQDGKFDSAMTIFENLVSIVNEIIAAAGINVSDGVKIALAVGGVAIRGIAVLLKDSTTDPQVAAVVNEKSKSSAASAKQASLVESLAHPKSVQMIFEASKP
jgi:hypothetical protein